ncbi:MAG: ArsR/SmtB family transcription factor [Phycisphaerales bacterium]
MFHALAHPARRAIIRQLSDGERNLSELASPLRMTFPAATKHVRVLERANLVRRRITGRQHLCSLRAAPLKEAMNWTEQFRRNWEARFEALDSLLDEMKFDEMKLQEQVRPASRPKRPIRRIRPSRRSRRTTRR